MTSKEFVIWMKGFVTACNDYAPTPKQWDIMKEELEKVSGEKKIGTAIGEGGWGTPNGTITTTPNSGFVTIANPNIVSFDPSTSTTYAYPSGSAWHYTNGGATNGVSKYINPYKPFSTQDDDSLEPKN